MSDYPRLESLDWTYSDTNNPEDIHSLLQIHSAFAQLELDYNRVKKQLADMSDTDIKQKFHIFDLETKIEELQLKITKLTQTQE